MYKLWNELEMNRRIIHFSGVIIPIAYLMGIVSWKFIGVILFILSLIVLKLEYVRLYHGFDNIIYDNLTRTYEADSIAGYALYVIGIFLAFLSTYCRDFRNVNVVCWRPDKWYNRFY